MEFMSNKHIDDILDLIDEVLEPMDHTAVDAELADEDAFMDDLHQSGLEGQEYEEAVEAYHRVFHGHTSPNFYQ